MPRQIKVSESVYARLKRASERSGIPMAQLVAEFVRKMEIHKVVKTVGEEKDVKTWSCDECEEDIPEDAVFCPYCGVEFDESEDEDEDDED